MILLAVSLESELRVDSACSVEQANFHVLDKQSRKEHILPTPTFEVDATEGRFGVEIVIYTAVDLQAISYAFHVEGFLV
jgi:hypothetical protein